MAGAVFGAFLVVAALVIMVLGGPIFLVVPILVLLLAGIFAGPVIFGVLSGGGRGTSGVPSTSQASYDPVAESQRGPGEV